MLRRGRKLPNLGFGASPADEIAKLAALRDSGSITVVEYESAKAKILA